MTSTPTVFVVEDDADVRLGLTRLLHASGFQVSGFASAEEYLSVCDPDTPGCLLLDLRLPRASGLELQDLLRDRGVLLPIVFLTGHGRVEDGVRAMKAGALDFLQKPVKDEVLLDAIRTAIAQDAVARSEGADIQACRARYATLTERQRQVFPLIVSGWLNKQIGFELGVSERTIKAHRSQVMLRMHASSLADLVRIAARLGLPDAPPPQ